MSIHTHTHRGGSSFLTELAVLPSTAISDGRALTPPSKRRHIVVSISTGTDPTNLLWYMPVAALPVNASTGALDLSRYDMRLPADKRAALPLTKLVNDFQASYAVVAAQGDVWTLQTSLNAPLGRCAHGAVTCTPAAAALALKMHASGGTARALNYMLCQSMPMSPGNTFSSMSAVCALHCGLRVCQ